MDLFAKNDLPTYLAACGPALVERRAVGCCPGGDGISSYEGGKIYAAGLAMSCLQARFGAVYCGPRGTLDTGEEFSASLASVSATESFAS